MKIPILDRANEWHRFIDSPRGNYYGYDLEVLANGVVALGQSIITTTPRTYAGSTIVVQYNSDGDEQWSHTRPSNYHFYPNIDRNTLEVNGPDEIYIAYSPPSTTIETSARIDKYNRTGDLIRPIDIGLDGPTEIQTLSINHANNELFVGLQIGTRSSGYRTKIRSYSSYGTLISDGAARDYKSIRQLELIDLPSSSTYPTGNRTFYTCGNVSDAGCYIEKFEQGPLIAPFPYDFGTFDNFVSNRSGGNRWVIDYFCERSPCTNLFMTASGLAGSKEMWKQEFNKPTDLELPSNLNIDTYVLKAKVNGVYHDLLRTDENLFVNGIKEFEIKTDTKTKSLMLNVTTDGRQVAFIVNWYNQDSKVIRTETFMAPLSNQLSEPMSEEVKSMSVNAVGTPMQISYYPNPSSGDFQVTLAGDTKLPAEAFVYDMTNTKIYQQAFGADRQLSVKLSGVKPGLYVLVVKGAGGEKRELIQIK